MYQYMDHVAMEKNNGSKWWRKRTQSYTGIIAPCPVVTLGMPLWILTGGSSQTIVLTDDPVAEMVSKGRLWPRIQRYLDYYYVITCEKTAGTGMDDLKPGDTDNVTGLKQCRAYSILCAKEIGALRFIKIRNPWGEEGAWLENGAMRHQSGKNTQKWNKP